MSDETIPGPDSHSPLHITPDQVEAVFSDSLAATQDGPLVVVVHGIMHAYALDRVKLKQHRDEIFAMLREMQPQFHQDEGGGWSFLNLCEDRHGDLWTGEHWTMEKLICLGMGLEVVWLAPSEREGWGILPGGMPYVVISLDHPGEAPPIVMIMNATLGGGKTE